MTRQRTATDNLFASHSAGRAMQMEAASSRVNQAQSYLDNKLDHDTALYSAQLEQEANTKKMIFIGGIILVIAGIYFLINRK